MKQKYDWYTIRQFLERVEWATVPAIALLIFGVKNKESMIQANAILTRMNKSVQNPIKRLDCAQAVVYAHGGNPKNRIGTVYFNHDSKLRECLARYVFDNGEDAIGKISMKPPFDASIGTLRFEFDNGNMTSKQLKEKILKHFTKKDGEQAIFFMASPNKAVSRHMDRVITDEKRRIEKLFSLVRELLPFKPNKVMATSYEEYLRDGKLYNFKNRLGG